ncbi:MAG TPA: hypothetical protein VG986_07240 [Pseudolabrys sp.]|nr:hypothetical protein [Pseudolabrys sp.]
MARIVHSRRLIALLAAYVVALQALLLPLTVAAGATFEPHLCASASSTDGAPAPLNQDSVCPCAAGCGMHCCAQVLAVPPQAVAMPRLAYVATALAQPMFDRAASSAHFGAQRARGPPLA